MCPQRKPHTLTGKGFPANTSDVYAPGSVITGRSLHPPWDAEPFTDARTSAPGSTAHIATPAGRLHAHATPPMLRIRTHATPTSGPDPRRSRGRHPRPGPGKSVFAVRRLIPKLPTAPFAARRERAHRSLWRTDPMPVPRSAGPANVSRSTRGAHPTTGRHHLQGPTELPRPAPPKPCRPSGPGALPRIHSIGGG